MVKYIFQQNKVISLRRTPGRCSENDQILIIYKYLYADALHIYGISVMCVIMITFDLSFLLFTHVCCLFLSPTYMLSWNDIS